MPFATLHLAPVFFHDDYNLLLILFDELLLDKDDDAFDVLDNVLLGPAFDSGKKEFNIPTLEKFHFETAQDRFKEMFAAFNNKDTIGVCLTNCQKFEKFRGNIQHFGFSFTFDLENAVHFNDFDGCFFNPVVAVAVAIVKMIVA